MPKELNIWMNGKLVEWKDERIEGVCHFAAKIRVEELSV